MAVRNGTTLEVRPAVANRRPSFRAVRSASEGSIFDLFGGVDGQPLSISADLALRITGQVLFMADAAVRVWRPLLILADMGLITNRHLSLNADTGTWITQFTTRQMDISLCIGVGVSFSSDTAITIYRVILREDHLILT